MKAGIILAGGKAERFGSDKALAELNGEVLIKHVHSALSESVDRVFICVDSEERIRKYRFLKDDITEFIVDMAEDFSRGPLRGILTGASNIEGEYFLVTSTDIPFIKPEAIDILFKKAQNVEAVLPVWSTSVLEPLFAVYSQKAVERISDYMHRYSTTTGKNPWAIDLIRNLDKISLIEVRNIDSTLGSFININTTDMLESLNRTGAEEADKQVRGNGDDRILENKPASNFFRKGIEYEIRACIDSDKSLYNAAAQYFRKEADFYYRNDMLFLAARAGMSEYQCYEKAAQLSKNEYSSLFQRIGIRKKKT